jgi:hypothetical protein
LTLSHPDELGAPDEWRRILRRVGWTLIAAGIIDITVMIYCIVRREAYASSLNIFALIAGIFLIRGSLSMARRVRFFSIFFVAGLSSVAILLPTTPAFRQAIEASSHSVASIVAGSVYGAAAFVIVGWSAWQLSRPTVRSAAATAGSKMAGAAVPGALGMSFAIFLVVAIWLAPTS